MKSHQPKLKLKGYSSASRVEDIFASMMVDVAHIFEIHDEYALVVPDEPDFTDLSKEKDREWLIEVVDLTMKQAGENNVYIELVEN